MRLEDFTNRRLPPPPGLTPADIADLECCECGRAWLHRLVRCTITGDCGACGAPWPCVDHLPRQPTRAEFRS